MHHSPMRSILAFGPSMQEPIIRNRAKVRYFRGIQRNSDRAQDFASREWVL